MAVAGEAPAQGIKMEVGIEDCLHIEFEFDKQKYHLQVRTFFELAHFRCSRHCLVPKVFVNLVFHPCIFLQDVILGKIYFLLVRIKIKFMELAVIRREAAGKYFFSGVRDVVHFN